jgi:hypothetical protein
LFPTLKEFHAADDENRMKELEFTKFRQSIPRILERVRRAHQPVRIVRAGEWRVASGSNTYYTAWDKTAA